MVKLNNSLILNYKYKLKLPFTKYNNFNCLHNQRCKVEEKNTIYGFSGKQDSVVYGIHFVCAKFAHKLDVMRQLFVTLHLMHFIFIKSFVNKNLLKIE